MITQTAALFLDAYRELNAKKLFWITMILSGLVVLIFAAIGINQKGVTFLWFDLGFIPVTSADLPPELLYKSIFMDFGLGLWLTWIATILAIISTSGIIPDMVTGGSVEMMLSKPISRARLFLTKYAAGLLFVTMQVGVFSVACLLVIGIRGGAWEFKLLLAVPLVVAFFSYLFCVCALIGLLTRSTIAALLLTLLFWFVLFLTNSADAILITFKSQAEAQRDALIEQVDSVRTVASNIVVQRKRNDGQEVADGYVATDEEIAAINPWFPRLVERKEEAEESLRKLKPWSAAINSGRTMLPKTGETIALLERALISINELERVSGAGDDEATTVNREQAEVDVADSDLAMRIQQSYRERSAWWILGTSLGFEAVVLGVCVIIFSRRDF